MSGKQQEKHITKQAVEKALLTLTESFSMRSFNEVELIRREVYAPAARKLADAAVSLDQYNDSDQERLGEAFKRVNATQDLIDNKSHFSRIAKQASEAGDYIVNNQPSSNKKAPNSLGALIKSLLNLD